MASTNQDGREWPGFTSLWSDPLAKSFLSEPAPTSLPTSGPLHKLLVATRRFCSREHTQRSAEEAVKARAVWVLAKLVHWLQQKPCKELQSASIIYPYSCDWFNVLNTLTTLLQEIGSSNSPPIFMDCCKQLEQAAGECMDCQLSLYHFAMGCDSV